MNLIRQIVSGPKNRYRKDGYNLDLTYITPRLIAMAYPAEGFEKLYRNSIDSVAQFLNKKHKNKYQIINVSGREINSQILNNISSFQWEDHKTPEFHMLLRVCDLMLKHLDLSPENVSVVHCKHGKGRTGTTICCFLLYIACFQSAEEAMKFYAKQRYEEEGYGVTQPCQIQYINYFSALLKNPTLQPSVVKISKITIKGKHSIKELYLKLRDVRENKQIFSTKNQKFQILHIEHEDQIIFKIRESPFFSGDAVLNLKEQKTMGNPIVAFYTFNTAFLSHKPVFEHIIDLKMFSPYSIRKSGILHKNFQVILTFKRICKCVKGNSYEKCELCSPYISNRDKQNWETIRQILQKRQNINREQLLNGVEVQKNQE